MSFLKFTLLPNYGIKLIEKYGTRRMQMDYITYIYYRKVIGLWHFGKDIKFIKLLHLLPKKKFIEET